MKTNVFTSLIGILCIFLMYACNQTNPAQAEEITEQEPKIGFAHNVYFWFNEGVTEEQIADFEKKLAALSACPSITAYYWGKPANTPRDIVDNSYDYAINVFFADREGQDAYQVDPLHEKFRQEVEGLFSRVQIYDNLIE